MANEMHIWKARLGHDYDVVFCTENADLLVAIRRCMDFHNYDECPRGLSMEYIGQVHSDQMPLHKCEHGCCPPNAEKPCQEKIPPSST